jgi:hypothetical protein
MVEQLTLNQRVAGSSPARFTSCLRQELPDCGGAERPHFLLILVQTPQTAPVI